MSLWRGMVHGLQFYFFYWGWSGVAKRLWILGHRGIQLILAFSWAKPAILEAGKGRRGMFYFFSFFTFIPLSSLSLAFISSTISSISLLSLLSLFSLSLGDDTRWSTRIDVSLNPNTINQSISVLDVSLFQHQIDYIWNIFCGTVKQKSWKKAPSHEKNGKKK